ncbi:LuxR C-terminal-related transcriptional regulator [Streptomyces yokosukanensis]|uniref:helix-turn-helix transcriptional regulator n=1 Tax=Streptomyces yokosukanensis TaxID=67386 RepID=UPI003430B24D
MRHERGAERLVARDVEQRQALGAVLTKGGTAIVGPVGVGKTALLCAVAGRLDAARFDVVWTVATRASRQVPFGAFHGLLGGARDRLDETRAYGALHTELARRSGRRTPVLVIDDVHHLDDRCAALALGLAAEGRAKLMVAARGEPGAAMSDAVVALWKDGYLERLDVAQLGLAGTARLLHALVEGEVARGTVDLLHRWTGGNPLLLTQLVRHARASGRLGADGGLWWWRGPRTVPPGLAEVFDHELDGLTSGEQDALAAIALGEPLALPSVEAVACDAVEALEERGLVRTTDGGGQILVRLASPLLAAAVHRKLPRLRRRRIAAALLAADTCPAPDPVVRARWQLEADGPVDTALLIRAAEAARGHDPELACRLARRALPGSSAAAVVLARALVESGDGAQARQVLERAGAEAATVSARLRAGIALAAHVCWVERDPAAAAADLAALGSRASSPAARGAVEGVRALVLLGGGRTSAALEAAERVLRTTVRGPGVAPARLARSVGLVLSGRTRDAVALAEATAADVDSPGELRELALALGCYAQVWGGGAGPALGEAGGGGADPVPGQGRDGAAAPGSGRLGVGGASPFLGVPSASHPASAFLDGLRYWALGDQQEAVARLREAVLRHSGGTRLLRTEATCRLAVCLAEAGRGEDAERALAACPPDAVGLVPGQEQWARAAVAAARGDVPAATAGLRAAAGTARREGCWAVAAECLTYAAWLAPAGPPTDLLDQLALAAGHIDAPRLLAGARAAFALARGSGTELLEHAVRLDGLGMRAPAWRLAERAVVVLRAHGRRHGDAVVLATRLRGGQGASAPPVRLDVLTARELEIASLAAAGLADRAISDRLDVSVRTVESHLARVYRKLGVRSRRDLPSVLRA